MKQMRPLDPSLKLAPRRHSRTTRGSRWSRLSPNDRTDRRRDLRFPVANTELRNATIAGRIIDLNRLGMAVETEQPLLPGRRYKFTLTIGEHVESLEVRALWSRLVATTKLPNGDVAPIFRAGITRTGQPDDHAPKSPG